jgi:hypothetical protein
VEDKGDQDAFKEQLRAIDEAKAKAQQYLDRTATHSPEHLNLPIAHWHETGAQLSVAQPGERCCGARAIEQAQRSMPYSSSLLLRNPAACIRPRGHDGQHASDMVHHLYRKSHWKALVWD